MSTDAIILVAAGLLWWNWRIKKGRAAAYGSAKDRIEAGVPAGGDSEATWWEKFHGQDIQLRDYSNGVGGVNPDPGSIGKATIASSINLAWNGDLRP